MKTHVLIAFIALLTAPLTGLPATTQTVRSEIAARSRAFTDALEQGDAAAAARVFTADAKLIVSGLEGPIIGREAIEGFWRTMSGNGMRKLVLDAHDLEGEGNLRFENGIFTALGAGGETLARGQYLFVWKREGRQWMIHRDIGSPGPPAAAPPASAIPMTGPDRVGFPADYRAGFKLLGTGGGEKDALVHRAFANAAAASAINGSVRPLPHGAVIAMEFSKPLMDGEGQLLRDEKGAPLPGEVVRVDVMRRGADYGAVYGASRAGEWEFASYQPDGATLMPPEKGAQCAACHRNAGADNDFVFLLRPPGSAP